MTDQELRQVIVNALEYANVIAMRDKRLAPAFLDGREEVALADLDLDSLATMELCIAIEAHTSVTIVPEDLQRIATLGELARAVRAGLR
jgi:acyl carrier protein